MSDNADKLLEAVRSLSGKTPDEIAVQIQKLGITGRAGTTYGCPLALLLKRLFGGQFVIGRKSIVRRSGASIDKVPTPKNLDTFVRKFDIGKYAGLVAPPPRCLRNEGSPPGRKGPNSKSGPSGKHVIRSKHVIKHRIAREVGRFAE